MKFMIMKIMKFMNAKINFNDDNRSAQLSDLTFESTVRKYPL